MARFPVHFYHVFVLIVSWLVMREIVHLALFIRIIGKNTEAKHDKRWVEAFSLIPKTYSLPSLGLSPYCTHVVKKFDLFNIKHNASLRCPRSGSGQAEPALGVTVCQVCGQKLLRLIHFSERHRWIARNLLKLTHRLTCPVLPTYST